MSASALEKKIAAALTGDITSTEVAALLEETEAAATHADTAAAAARERALDPANLDPAARTAQQEAEHLSARLLAAVPRLRERP